jgi:integrase
MKLRPTVVQRSQAAIDDAKARVRRGENSAHLLRNYVDRDRAYIQPFFGTTPIDKVDGPKVRAFTNWLTNDKGLSTSSAAAILSFLSVILRMAYEDGVISRIPHLPRRRQKPAPRPAFTRTGYLRLLQILKEVEKGVPVIAFHGNKVDWELRAIVTFMVNSFFRPGDIFKVQNKHVTVVPKDAEGPAYLRIDLPSSKGHHAPIITMPVAVPIYERTLANHRAAGFGKPNDYVFLPSRQNRAYAHEIVRRQFRQVLIHADLLKSSKGVDHTLYSLRHSALTFRLLNAQELDLVTLARAARTSVDMIDRYYASTLTAEMNRDKLHSFRRPTRFLTDGKGG